MSDEPVLYVEKTAYDRIVKERDEALQEIRMLNIELKAYDNIIQTMKEKVKALSRVSTGDK